MMGSLYKAFVGVAVAGSMFASSTAAVAATSVAPTPQLNPWAALTAMTGGAPAATMCGAAGAAAAAQTPGGCVLPAVDAPPPPPVAEGPPPPLPVPAIAAPAAFGFSPILVALAAIVAGVGLYFGVKGKSGGANSPG
jgi:hypothetical protein